MVLRVMFSHLLMKYRSSTEKPNTKDEFQRFCTDIHQSCIGFVKNLNESYDFADILKSKFHSITISYACFILLCTCRCSKDTYESKRPNNEFRYNLQGISQVSTGRFAVSYCLEQPQLLNETLS